MQAPANLRQFIDSLEARGQLKRVTEAVDCHLEITALSEPVMKAQGPAILFENVKERACPLAINLFGTEERVAKALGAESLSHLAARLSRLLAPPRGGATGLLNRLSLAWPKLKEFSHLMPKVVKDAPCQEVVLTGGQASLEGLPILTCWPGDAGPFITLPQVITAHPGTGGQNYGMYRMQVYDQRSTGMHWHPHKGGAAHLALHKGKMPVAVALGGPPAAIYAACAPWPEHLDEALLTGFLMQRPLTLVKATQSGLLLPAEAEIVLEGYVDANEGLRMEGPFGDHTGFYSPPEAYPVFHLTALTRRKNPIYPATVVGPPPMEDFYLGQASERLFLPLLQMVLPEITDYHLPPEGVFHNLVLVAIKKSYPGQAFKVMQGLWGMGQMMFSKVIVVVDEGVDLRNHTQAWWYALSNFDPSRDTLLGKGPTDALDHASQTPLVGGKLGIDGTAKLPGESGRQPWPQAASLPRQLKTQAMEKLKKWRLI